MPIYEFKCNLCNKMHEVHCSYGEALEMDGNTRCMDNLFSKVKSEDDNTPYKKQCEGLLIKQVSLSGFRLEGKDWSSRGR